MEKCKTTIFAATMAHRFSVCNAPSTSGGLQGFRSQMRSTDVSECPALCCIHPSVIQALHWLFGERPEHRALIDALAVSCVEVVLVNVFYHRVWNQVFDAQIPSQSPADLCGARLVTHPFPHVENVSAVGRERVRLVHGPLGLQPPSADADQPEASSHLLHVVFLPQAGDLERFEEIGSTQELQLGRGG